MIRDVHISYEKVKRSSFPFQDVQNVGGTTGYMPPNLGINGLVICRKWERGN